VAAGCSVAEICAIRGHSPKAVHTIIALAAPVPNAATAESTWRQGKRDRGMDDRLLEELCRWHDEQAALLRSEAGTLAAAAVAADMHAKTSAALHEAAAEIKRLRSGAEPSRSKFGWAGSSKSDRSISNIPAPIFWSLAIGQVLFLGWLIFETLGWL
jgi:hypothetical protein